MKFISRIEVFRRSLLSKLQSHRWLAVLSLAILLVIVVIFAGQRFATAPVNDLANSGRAVNLLKNQDWSHFAGATQDSAGVRITALGRAIVNQDGSGGQANPPVNVRGPHLNITGGFNVNFSLRDVPQTGSASLYLYGSVPIIYDEWRYRTPQLRVDVSQYSVTVSLWDGHNDEPKDRKVWQAEIGEAAYIELNFSKNRVLVLANGKEIGETPDRKVFSSGQVWFGADAPLGSTGWLLHSLTAEALGKNSLQAVAGPQLKIDVRDSQSLRALAAANPRHLPIGAAVANYALFSDADYRRLVASQLNQLVPENELKPQFVHPQPNIYSFTEADSLVDFALINGMSVHGHTLEFSEANPRWMQDTPLSTRQEVLTDHITTVVKHFGSKIPEWDVVDEPLNDDNNLRQNIWSAAMGENYIDASFKAARAANPDAKLYINEYGLEADGPRWDEFLALIGRLQSRGVPINGVGFQAHVHEQVDETDPVVLGAHIKQLASMRLVSRISEIDVYGDNLSNQAQQYAVVLRACLDSPTCTSFTTWGVSDRYGSTTKLHNYPLQLGNDLIWDVNLKPKPTYNKLQTILK